MSLVNGLDTHDLETRKMQVECLEQKAYKDYLHVTYTEDRLDALKHLIKIGECTYFLWKYAYAYATQDYEGYMVLLKYCKGSNIVDVKTDSDGYVKVYRGIDGENLKGRAINSWTTSKKTAEYFATRDNIWYGRVFEGVVHKDYILTQVDLRKENEVILDNTKVKLTGWYDPYPLIEDKDVQRYNKRMGTSGIHSYLVYNALKGKKGLKIKDYHNYLCRLEEVKGRLVLQYGDFINNKDLIPSIWGIKNISPVYSTEDDSLLATVVHNVYNVVDGGSERTKTPILISYIKTKRHREGF